MEKQKNYEDEVELTQLVRVFIKRKWLIIGGTLIFSIAAVVYSFLLPRVYRSDGFFQFPEVESAKGMMQKGIKKNISIPDYKKYSSVFTNSQRFVEFIVNRGFFKGVELDEIKRSTEKSNYLNKRIKPVFSFSKQDMKELGQISRNTKNYVVGVRLNDEKQSPDNAQKCVKINGLFIKNCILYMKLNDYINSEFNDSQTGVKKFENEIIKSEFKLDQLNKKIGDIKNILKKYPQSKNFGNRELVSVEKGGYRFLSPIAQLVGIESEILDIKEQLAHFRRDKKLMNLEFDFFLKSKEILNRKIFGEDLLKRIIELKEKSFNKKENGTDIGKEVFNTLTIDLDNFTSVKDEMQFVSGPTFSKKPAKPRKKLIVIIAFILFLFFFIFLAFFIDWWKMNIKEKG